MGNTQVTPIKPATPPLMSLAGKLGAKTRDASKIRKPRFPACSTPEPYLICLSAIYEKPRPVGVSLNLWDCPSLTDLCCTAGTWCARLWGNLPNENATFLQQTAANANLKIYISWSGGQESASSLTRRNIVTKQAACVNSSDWV